MIDLFSNLIEKFPYLSTEKVGEIIQMGEIVPFAEGEVFVRAGQSSTRTGLILQGMMRNYITNEDGEEVTVLLATEMRIIAPYSTIFLGKAATETCAAVEPSLLFVMDFHDFKDKTLVDPVILKLYCDLLESTFIAAAQRIEDFTQMNPEQRYKRILEMETFLIDRAPLKYLASYLGIKPESLSRIRKRLSRSRN